MLLQIRKEKGEDAPHDGTVIIEPSELGWGFKGEPLTGYLMNQATKATVLFANPLTKLVPSRVYSFKLPGIHCVFLNYFKTAALFFMNRLGSAKSILLRFCTGWRVVQCFDWVTCNRHSSRLILGLSIMLACSACPLC